MKTITIKVKVPSKMRWLAQTSWGEWIAFPRKPKIILDDPGTDPEIWRFEEGEISLTPDIYIKTPAWKKSLRKI